MKTRYTVACGLALMVLGLSSARAQASDPVQMHRLEPVHLKRGDPQTAPLWSLWADLLAVSERKWSKVGPATSGGDLPAWVLVTSFHVGDAEVLVSTFGTLFDCKLPPGGKMSTQLYQQCPMRIRVTSPLGTRVIRADGDVCHLWVMPPTPAAPAVFPDQNYVEARLDAAAGTLTLRTTEYGRRVGACDKSINLGQLAGV